MFFYLDLLGCAIFAISAILAAVKKELDVLGVFVVALVSAIGGGTIRDLLLNTDVFWLKKPIYIYIILGTSLLSYFLFHIKESLLKFIYFADAFGLTLFSVLGLKKSLEFGIPPINALILGILTGIAGGIIRDTMFNDKPVVLRREIYVTAAILSCVVFLLIDNFTSLNSNIAITIAVVLGFALRVFAIIKKVHLPIFFNIMK